MFYQEYYKFIKEDFDQHGFCIKSQQWFMDLIGEFEEDFHNKFPLCYANHLFANHSSMSLISKAMNLEEYEGSGMDLINGAIDVQTNLEMEDFSDNTTIFAIGSKMDENIDEPILLVINDKQQDGLILLKYIDDDESEYGEGQVPEFTLQRQNNC